LIEVSTAFLLLVIICATKFLLDERGGGEAFSTVPPPLPAPAEDNDVAEEGQPFRTHGPSVVGKNLVLIRLENVTVSSRLKGARILQNLMQYSMLGIAMISSYLWP